jgi:hypothetical protein
VEWRDEAGSAATLGLWATGDAETSKHVRAAC